MAQTDEALVEALARAQCATVGFDPDEIMANDAPRWRYYVPGATAVLPIIAAREQAVREALTPIFDKLDRDKNSPGHGHDRDGIWDDDNGDLAGKPCDWCAQWKRAREVFQSLPAPPALNTREVA